MPETCPSLSLVIPLYRTGEGVADLLSALRDLPVPGGYEVVLVDDGSPDDTAERCRRLLPELPYPATLVCHMRNFGEHHAILSGLRHACGDFAVTMDDDLQNPPEEALRLHAHCRDHGFDVVFSCYETKQHHWFRNLGSRLVNWCISRLIDKPSDLYLSSFRCLAGVLYRQVADYAGPYPYVDGLILNSTQRIGTLQVRHEERAAGRSGYNLRRLVRLSLAAFTGFSYRPLRFATVGGFFLAACGGVGIAVVLAEALLFDANVRGWPSLMVALLFFSGVQLAVMGMLGEYVGRTWLTVNHKPQSVLRDVVKNGR